MRHILYLCAILLICPVLWADDQTGQFVPGFEDIPLMSGMEVDEEGQVLFDTTTGRIAETTVATTQSQDAVRKFYQGTLTQLGWQKIEDFKFRREGEELTLKITKQSAGTLIIEFELSPIPKK